MLTITKQNNALIVKGDGNSFYPDNGTNSYPLNSISVVIDESDMATFRSAANNDVLFSGLIQDITIEGEKVTKDNIIEKFDAVANGAQGGGGDVTQAQLDEVKAIAQDADTKADAVTSRIQNVETQMGDKQDTLVSGVNIKTINSQSILGSGDLAISGVSEEQAQEIAKIPTLETDMMGKQDTLVSGTNIKTINGNSILGEGNLVIEGGDIDLSNYYNKTEVDTKLDTKQNTLVSGTNIKTINNESVLGEGNIELSGVSEEQAQEIAKIPTLETEIAQKANVSDVPTVQTGYTGTNKNYIYSDVRSPYAGVISSVYPSYSANKIELRLYKWTTDTTQAAYSTEFLPNATTTRAGVMTAADKTKLDSISNEWTGTQQEYDALTTKDNNTIYYVTE